jgi:predicted DNA-binding transcriptional regulator YafY
MNRVDRLLGYLLIFQSHELVRAQDLAARFEVSERTVYRDIEALYEVGVPLVGLPGEGYQLMPGYYLPPVMFSEAEAKALFLAIAMLTGFTGPGPTHAAAQSALEKIRIVLPKATLIQVEALQAVLGFYTIARPTLDLDNQTFLQLQQAIQQRRVVLLQYHAQHDNQITERAIEPLQLAYLDNVWVVTAYCRLRQEQRVFRLDRIDQLQLTKEIFPARSIQPRHTPEEGELVTIQVDAAIERWVREAQHFTFVSEAVTEKGATLMHYQVRDADKFIGWLLQWGPQVELVAPLALRRKTKQRVLAMAERYDRP